ncbi:MAG: DUF4173 domain-containing protein [Chloroflexi bacterium]|nr:DUF4173 domain-containing protein [Chloroflexota bacterium]
MTDSAESQPPSRFSIPNATRFVAAAFLLGLSVDYLFYDKPLGLSFPLFIGFGSLALLALALVERVRPALSGLWLVIPISAFAAMVYVRAEPLTTFVNVAVTLALGALWVRAFAHGRLFHFGLLDFVINFILAVMETILRPWPILLDAVEQAASRESGRRVWLPIARGLLIALPFLCLFSALLSAADLIFADRLRDVLEWLNLDNIPELVAHSLTIALASLVAIGVLAQAIRPFSRYSLVGAERDLLPRPLGLIESGIVLGSINLLFAAFVAIQFRYLFGGTANITEAGYTYSEYARKGFGELTAVVFITLLILLALASLTRRATRSEGAAFIGLNVIMIAFVGVIVVSALQRLLLYEEIFGFTRLRTYSHVAIIWLGALFVPYLVALAAGRLRWFAPGALFCIIGFTATLNGLNVDRFIAERNIDYYHRNGKLHANYLITLSDDVLPELMPLFSRNDSAVADVLGPGLLCRADRLAREYADAPWQSAHLSHRAASDALRELPLSRWRIYRHPYGDFVYVGANRVTCSELLYSGVLEPGLTSEYR